MFQSTFSPAASSSSFGQPTFGRPTFGTAAQPTGFGTAGNSLFGATQQPATNLFGASQPQSTSFGTTGLFGAQTQATANTFGAPQATATSSSGGLFGTSGSAFGQTKPAFGFGGNTSGGLFGQSTMFGQNNQAQPGTSTLFGGTTAFGGTAAVGTTTKFVPVTGTDTMMRGGSSQTINTRHLCITCMKEYENKSLDELRHEDYKASRKGPQQGTQTSGGFFGASAQPSLFGATSSTAQPTTNLFGATENKSLFGQTSSAFGQPTNTTSLFGKPNTAFGAAATTQSTAFSFNTANTFGQANTTAIKPFGAAAPQTNNLFGTSTAQAAPTFGTSQASTFGTFGTNQNQGLNFNQNKPAFSLGGNTTSTGFGFGTNTATSGTSLFGQKPATTGFGLPTASPFGTTNTFGAAQPAQNTNLFNSFNKPVGASPFQFNSNTTPNTSLGTNTFGAGTSLFGNTANANKPATLFGNTNNSTGLFGNTTFGNNTGTTSAFGQGVNTGFNLGGTNNAFNNPLTAPQASLNANNINSQQILNLASLPYYAAPSLYKGIIPTASSNSKLEELVLPSFQKNRINSKNITINSSASENKIKIKPVGSSNVARKSLFDDLTSDSDSEKSFSTRRSSKTLILLPKKTKSMLSNVSNITNVTDTDGSGNTTVVDNSYTVGNTSSEIKDNTVVSSPSTNSANTPVSSKLALNIRESVGNVSPVLKVSDLKINQPINMNESSENKEKEFHIKLTRQGYYLSPTLAELKQLMSHGGPCSVDGFTIGHEEFGNICFLESIDLSELNNIDLDSIFEFRFKEVILYPDDGHKPPLGTALNRPAKVTLLKVWPKDKTTGQLITDVKKIESMNYESIVIRACKRMNVEFVSYQSESGSWCFKVQHFSKYGLLDSDEEGESEAKKPKIFVSPPVVPAQHETLVNEKLCQSPKPKLRNDILAKDMNRTEALSNSILHMDETIDYMECSTELLARHLETDPYKVQMMKQCFEDDVIDNTGFPLSLSREFFIENKAHYSGGSLFKSNNFVQQPTDVPPSVRTLSPASELDLGDEDDHSLDHSGALVLDNKPNKLDIVPVKMYQCRVSKEDGIKSTRKNFLNMEYFGLLDRRFSTTWLQYKRSLLLTCNDNLMPDDYSDVCNLFDVPPVSCNLLQVVDTSTPCLTQRQIPIFKDHLQVCVQNSEISMKQNSPFVTLKSGNNAIHEHCNLSSVSNVDVYESQVWKLCVALWGTLDVMSGAHEINMKRKSNVTDWLESVMETSYEKSGNPETKIFKLVCEHNLYEAITCAQQSENLYLSGAVAMLGSSETGQAFMQSQLSHYVETSADVFVNQDLLKLMLLVSGQPLYDSSKGILNVCEGLEWKVAFGLHLWYLEPYFKSVPDVVHKFEKAWSSEEAYCLPPSPQHGSAEFKDLCYHLLMLYSNKSHSLVELLNPGTHTENPLDFRMSWFIMQALKSLGYSHLDAKIANKYHLSFASQLLSYDLWEFAIFVFMHIEDATLRRHHIDQVLERHVVLTDNTLELTAKEAFLVETLHIPAQWIYKCKGHLAMYKGEYWEACEYFLQAEEYFKCHQVLFDKVVAVAVLNHQYDFIEDVLAEMFASMSETDKKTWWLSGGDWLMKYFHIANELSQLQEGVFNEVLYLVPDFIQELEAKYTSCDDGHKSYYCELFERLVLLLRKSGEADLIFYNQVIPIASYLVGSFA